VKPLRARISEAAASAGIGEQVIEKDYALSYILAGIAAQPEMSESMIFKGGTALKKLFLATIVSQRIWTFPLWTRRGGMTWIGRCGRRSHIPVASCQNTELSLWRLSAISSEIRIRLGRKPS
jgi:hypothetical protein